jgi:hypothetical protein
MDSTGSRTIEPLFENKYFCGFYFIVTMPSTQTELDQDYTS